MIQTSMLRLLAQTTTVLSLAGAVQAGSSTTMASSGGKGPQAQVQPKEESVFDSIWGLASLYKNDSNTFLEELALTGRYHGQYHYEDGGSTTDDDWDNRRFRLGLEATMLEKHLKLKAEMFSDLNPGGEFYEGFTELWAAWKFSDELTVTIGKQKPKFGYEWSTSSRLIKTFERGALINQFKPEYAPGASFSGKSGKLSYYGGVFSDQVDGEFGQFDGGYSIVASLGYDVADVFGTDKAQVRLDYIHSERDSRDTIFTTFDNGVSASLDIKQGDLGLVSEVLAAFGDQNNVALILTPTYDITKKLQLVGRYQLGLSDSDTGLAPLKRYEKDVGAGNGDVYNAFYLGFNYFIYGDKLKLMAGAEYSTMSGGKGNDTLSLLAGIRAYW